MVYQPKRKYEWGEGYTPKVNADVVGGVLEEIQEECGTVTKEEFLERSRPSDSPTHELFEWNDGIAAEQYRLEQSRHAIVHLRVVYLDDEEKERKVSAVVNISPKKVNAQYQSIDVVLSDKETSAIVFNRIKAELNAFIERNRHFKELGKLLIENGEKLLKSAE